MIEDASSMDRVVVRRRFSTRTLILVVLGLALAAALVLLYPSMQRWASADRSVDAARLRMGRVERGNLLRDVSVQGRVVAADYPTLVSPVQGIVSVRAKAGDVVSRGTVLARIESPELLNQLKQEQSMLLSMTADLDRLKISAQQAYQQNQQQAALLMVRVEAAQRALKRAKSLVDEGLGNAIDYERAQDDLKVASLELEHAKEKTRLEKETADFEIRNRSLLVERQQLVVNDVERKISELTIVSPVTGMVARVDVKDKDTVQPSRTLFSVVDLSEYQVEIQVPEDYADEISNSTSALIQYDGKDYEGYVKSLSPEVEASQVRGIVAFAGQAPTGLKQNQRVSTRLILNSRIGVLKVTRGPFLETLGGRQAYVVDDAMATLRPITVGASSVTEVEIVSGLSEGEQIILSDMTRFEGAKTILLRQ